MRRLGLEGAVLVVAILVSWVVPRPAGGLALLAGIAALLGLRAWRGELRARRVENVALLCVMLAFAAYLATLAW